jgi:hypothetical protein
MKKSLALVVLAAAISSACVSIPYEPYAREVKKRPRQGGVIALRSEHKPEDRARADYLMNSNCGDEATVKLDEEGEVVVGEKMNTTANKYRDERSSNGFKLGGIRFANTNPSDTTTSSSETVQVKEWQIAYSCEANAPAPKSKKIGKK